MDLKDYTEAFEKLLTNCTIKKLDNHESIEKSDDKAALSEGGIHILVEYPELYYKKLTMENILRIFKRIWTFPYVYIKKLVHSKKNSKKQYKKKLEELRKRDPFVYKKPLIIFSNIFIY